MRIIKPSFKILTPIDGYAVLKHIEVCGRVCYKSEDNITSESALKFVRKLKVNEHLAVLEHYNLSIRMICDRGVSHELVRHRIASYCQESTRYCNYKNAKFGNAITVIKPSWVTDEELNDFLNPKGDELPSSKLNSWYWAMRTAENAYFDMLKTGATPQEARSVLPNSLKTEIIVTTNLREWMHILKLRCADAAHPDMRELMIPIRTELQRLIPIIF